VSVGQIVDWRGQIARGALHPMALKSDLAGMIITDYHGASAARAARETFERVVRQREIPEDIETRAMAVADTAERLPRLLSSLGLTSSVAEATRLITSGAVSVDGERISEARAEIDLSEPREYLFKVGKRRFLRLRLSSE
jgi:tyrosyl-tRNA synthetase